MVTMRDGTQIAVRVYRPDAEGAFPTLFAASPYQYITDDLPHSRLFLWREVGPVEWYVENGYAYVHADVRGTGKSEGTFGLCDVDRAARLCRADRVGGAPAVVVGQGRRHRPVVLRLVAVVHGHRQPAVAGVHRAL